MACQNAVIHSSLLHRAEAHHEKIFNAVAHGKRQTIGKFRPVDIVKHLLFPAVGKNRNICLSAEISRCKKCCVAASGNVYRAVRILFHHTLKLSPDFIGIVEACVQKHRLHLQTAMGKVFLQSFLFFLVAGDLLRAEINRPFRPESIRTEDVFNRAVIIQFNQGFHILPLFCCYYLLFYYFVCCLASVLRSCFLHGQVV